jgi:GNAT superfamily N-acetyltransferase
MSVQLRRAEAADAAVLGDICYRAFKAIAEAHGFAPDFPSAEVGVGAVGSLIADPRVYDIVAEVDGVMVGSNFLAEHNTISGVGPITVDPALQNDGAGRVMMAAVMQRSHERGFAGIRLVQAGYHSRSLALYLKLGFEAREHLACLQGPALGQAIPGCAVRAATREDLSACNRLCLRVHGHDRGGELAVAIDRGQARVVERAGRLSGYATGVAYFNHSVGETNDDLKALIGAASAFGGPGFLVPTRNGELMRWCLEGGLQVTQTLTLMTMGLYNQPDGAWLPSVIY